MRTSNHPLSLFAYPPRRAAFVAYFLGAVVPLVVLGVVVERHLLTRINNPAGDLHLLLGVAGTLGAFLSISLLSLACFLMLRRVLGDAVEQQRRLASFDSVTGLPNSRLYRVRLEQAIEHARNDEALVATGFIDLDGFKRVNDMLGHAAGDKLLREVGNRIVGSLRLSDSVGSSSAQSALARQGGDEFTFLLTRVATQEDVGRIASRVVRSLEAPFLISEKEVFVTASLGIAIYPLDGDDASALLENADQAMYWAKDRGRNNYQFYSASMNQATERKTELEAGLRRALDRDEFSLVFQPVRDAREGTLNGAEALIRWNDPEGNPIEPAEFIPVAEETGLIAKIGEWVLRTASAQAQAWRAAGFAPIRLAVNVSGHQIRQPGLVESVIDALESTGTSAAFLDLEITESTIMQDDEVTNETIRRLDEIGVGLVLDDFGTGYSSLSYLKRFPVSRVKVDRSFIEELETNRQDQALTGAIISMAHGLGLGVVAESVETLEQIEVLQGLHCDELQGYLLGKPVSAEEFTRLLIEEKQESESSDPRKLDSGL
jgi:diguanylate cyclase (GGDEF)-like protein